jgi:hypothetical protein
MKLTKFILLFLFAANANAQLVINEFMPSNATSVIDAFGEYDDWVELYNYTDTVVHLNGWSITDSFGDKRKFKFKVDSVKAKGYFMVWVDNDSIQGRNHANFKLKAGGEFLMITSPAKKNVDSFFYDSIATDKSWARKPNGKGAFKVSTHTFNRANDTSSAIKPIHDQNVLIYPNPTSGLVNIENVDQDEPIKIYDIKGGNALLLIDEKQYQVKLTKGVFLLKYKSYTHRIVVE